MNDLLSTQPFNALTSSLPPFALCVYWKKLKTKTKQNETNKQKTENTKKFSV